MMPCESIGDKSRCKPLIRLYQVGTQSKESRQSHWECCNIYLAFAHKCDYYCCQNILMTLRRFHRIAGSSERTEFDWATSEQSLLLHDSLAFAHLVCWMPLAKPDLSWLLSSCFLRAKPVSLHCDDGKYQCSVLALRWNSRLEQSLRNWPDGPSLWIDWCLLSQLEGP